MSEIIIEKELSMLSKELGEPKSFLKWRSKLLKQADELQEEECPASFYGDLSDKRSSSHRVEYVHKNDSGVKVLSWNEAMKAPALAQTICECLNRDDLHFVKNRNTALNAALFADGRVVEAPAGSAGSIVLETRFLENTADIFVIIARKGARLTLFEQIGISDISCGRTTVVIAEEGSKVEFQSIVKGKGVFLNNKMSVVEKNSDVQFFDMTVDEMSGEFYNEHFLLGSDASATVATILIGRENTQINVCDTVHHLADRTRSTIAASGVGGDASHIAYQALINVKNNVRDAVGEQKAKFLMVSPNAKIDAIPALDIASKDIACSHSVSISRLQDEDLYYPKSRGIGEQEAKRLMVSALLNSELSRVRDRETSKLFGECIAAGVSKVVK